MDVQKTKEEKKTYTYSPVQKLGSIRQETSTGLSKGDGGDAGENCS